MRICIFGAGAIGGYLGIELSLAGSDVTLIARGAHLDAIRRNGLTLLIDGETKRARIPCTDDPAQAGPHDFVFLAMKAHSIAPALDSIEALLTPTTAVVTAQNGIPWWYFYSLKSSFENRKLESVDPEGRIWSTIGPERAIGCVVYPSCEIVEPGVIRYGYGRRFMLGEPDGSRSGRVVALSRAMSEAGFKAPVRNAIRDDIWLKLWGNLSLNPVSVLTQATLEEMANDAGARNVLRGMMTEASAVAEKLGVRFRIDMETRIDWAGDAGSHKTSMLQDLEMGRPMEIEAIVASVAEMGRLVGVPTPIIDTVLSLVRLRVRVAKRP